MRLRILGYHKVGAEAEYGRYLNIETARLESHVRFFARRGFTFLTGRELADSWPERGVAFTFDDGFRGAILEGLPTLERYGGRGTAYVVTDLVGGKSNWKGDPELPLADWNELKAAAKRGHEIGNHTRTHPRLNHLDEEAQRSEIFGAAQRLAAEGFGEGSFCLPYGSHGAVTRGLIEEAGYKVNVTIQRAIACDTDDRLMLPRILLSYGDALPRLLYKLWVRPYVGWP